MNTTIQNIFKAKLNNVFGMIHVKPLPGTPLYGRSIKQIIYTACKDAEMYMKCGVDGIVVENMHDIPYVPAKEIGPEIVSSMTKVCSSIRQLVPEHIPCGLQILAAANEEAIAVAHATDFQFIRAEGFVFGHVADEGYMDACADIKKKHSSHAITHDVSLIETAKAAEFFLTDGIIVTGTATGQPTKPSDVIEVKSSVNVPVLVGSGITVNNVHEYRGADGFIIGSHFKKHGMWQNELNETTIIEFMNCLKND